MKLDHNIDLPLEFAQYIDVHNSSNAAYIGHIAEALIEFDTFWTTTGRRLVDRTIGRSLVAWLQLYSSRSRNLLQYNAS